MTIEQEPSQWRDMVVVSLVREGINKHKARELADHFAAQPEQEPVPEKEWVCGTPLLDAMTQDYVPTQRPWVGLTEFQFAEIYNAWNDTNGSTPWGLNQALEAKLKELNK